MQAAIEQFRVNLERVRNLGALVQTLNAQTTAALDLSDILRAELVMVVSALDHYVHELVRLGMLEVYRNNRVRTPSFLQFQISLEGAMNAITNPPDAPWIEQEIRRRNGRRTFQTPDDIAEAIRLISEAQLWNEVAANIGIAHRDVRERLRIIVNRRNQIVHEADMDPSYPGRRWPIDAQMVDESVDFIEQIVEAMYVVVS